MRTAMSRYPPPSSARREEMSHRVECRILTPAPRVLVLQGVLMAHALRRISYATCEPLHAQFSFLAREPRGQLSLQYCHSFLAGSPQQVSFA